VLLEGIVKRGSPAGAAPAPPPPPPGAPAAPPAHAGGAGGGYGPGGGWANGGAGQRPQAQHAVEQHAAAATWPQGPGAWAGTPTEGRRGGATGCVPPRLGHNQAGGQGAGTPGLAPSAPWTGGSGAAGVFGGPGWGDPAACGTDCGHRGDGGGGRFGAAGGGGGGYWGFSEGGPAGCGGGGGWDGGGFEDAGPRPPDPSLRQAAPGVNEAPIDAVVVDGRAGSLPRRPACPPCLRMMHAH